MKHLIATAMRHVGRALAASCLLLAAPGFPARCVPQRAGRENTQELPDRAQWSVTVRRCSDDDMTTKGGSTEHAIRKDKEQESDRFCRRLAADIAQRFMTALGRRTALFWKYARIALASRRIPTLRKSKIVDDYRGDSSSSSHLGLAQGLVHAILVHQV